MTGKPRYSNAIPVADLTGAILDPLLRKRTGMSVALLQSWEEIAGPRLSANSRPEKIQWMRRVHDGDPYEPAVLIVACEGLAALHLQHETTQIIERVNAFFGFAAIGRIRIVQKPVNTTPPRRPKLRALTEAEQSEIGRTVANVEDEGLRTSLERLGASVRAKRNA